MIAFKLRSYNIADHTGYGVVYKQLKEALEQEQSLHVFDNAPNVINFLKPEDYKFQGVSIGYTPWETTTVPEHWVANMQKVDDLWTTATWLVDVFEAQCGTKPWVLPHGLSHNWRRIRHHVEPSRPFTFVHVGEPAVRKGGDILLDVWDKHFRHNPDVRLIIKSTGPSVARILGRNGVPIGSAYTTWNVDVIDRKMCPEEMWQLYALSDCMIYPSRGEGFGLIPLESMASGMPTILPAKHMGDFTWAGIELNESKLIDVPDDYHAIHTGQWLDHSKDELIFLMEHVIANYHDYATLSYEHAEKLHNQYDWAEIANRVAHRIADL